jgi:hypothetical protein
VVSGVTETSDNGLPYFDSEQEFQDYLEVKFEAEGFDVIQEVSPHGSRYRADLLLLHDEYGPIGMELKRLTGGTDAGKAHQQIVRQYSGRKYIGRKVKKWVFAPYMPKLQYDLDTEGRTDKFQRGKLEVLEHFFQAYGIGVLNVHSRPYARIKWGANRTHMLPAFGMAREIYEPDYDLDSIEERIATRLYEVTSYGDI